MKNPEFQEQPVYFDHNATTPLDPRVAQAMVAWLGGAHGNPSSAHRFGRAARQAVETARGEVAGLLGAAPAEIVFTASGTEANNAVIFGAGREPGGHFVLSAFEHPSVEQAVARLEAGGARATRVRPDADGVVVAAAIASALRPETRLVCLMLANNELGTLQPVAEVARLCRARGVAVLSDAVQAVGKVPVDAPSLGVDYLSLGGHKFQAPLGAAALWIRPGAAFAPLFAGAGQEGGRRASTENVPAIVGLGRAAALATSDLAWRERHLSALRERFEAGLGEIPDAILHGASAPRLPHTTHVAFPGLAAQDLMLALDEAGFAVSTGAACTAGKPQRSTAARALGWPDDEAFASLRVSFGVSNTREQVEGLLDLLPAVVASLRRAKLSGPPPP